MKMIYATGDLHGNTLRFQPQYFPEQTNMTKDDYMIVCGDFGCVWNATRATIRSSTGWKPCRLRFCSWMETMKTLML